MTKSACSRTNISLCEKFQKSTLYTKVSAQTLLERGLNIKRYCEYSNNRKQLPSAYLLRQDIAKHILDPSNSGYDIGMSLGFIAQHFGARASVSDVAHKILLECTQLSVGNHVDCH